MICPNCQKEVPDTAKACGYCGQWLAGETKPAAAPAQNPTPKSLPWLSIGLGLVALVLAGVIVYLLGRDGGQVNAEATVLPAETSAGLTAAVVALEPTATPKPHTPTSRPPTDTPTLQPTVTPKPPTDTPTPRPTPTPTATIDADPMVYDNFNNPAFDGSLNTGRWERKIPWGEGCTVEQHDGVMVYQSSGISNSPLCILSTPLVPATETGVVEGKIYAETWGTGNYNIGVVQFVSPISDDSFWIAQCGIFRVPADNWLVAGLNVDPYEGEGTNKHYEGGSLDAGQWYKFRIELDPFTTEVKCYLNDALIASHVPQQAEAIRAKGIFRELVGYWEENTETTYYFDDVRFLPGE